MYVAGEKTLMLIVVYNDFMIQITYPDDITREIDSVYRNKRDFESFEVAKLIKIIQKKTDLKVTVMRNPVVAEQLRNYILSRFKKSTTNTI